MYSGDCPISYHVVLRLVREGMGAVDGGGILYAAAVFTRSTSAGAVAVEKTVNNDENADLDWRDPSRPAFAFAALCSARTALNLASE
jgi:hypothetical protein